MCDYSLENVKSRPAKVADRLVSTTFTGTITRGFADGSKGGDPDVAVCLRPGTELAFDKLPTFDHPVTQKEHTAPSKTARFREVNVDNSHTHHDSLEFADGTIVPLTRLSVGQYVTVLQLGAEPTLKKVPGTIAPIAQSRTTTRALERAGAR